MYRAVRDGDGQITCFEVTHDPEFLPEDQLAAVEWQGEQDLKCTSCGLPRDETMRDENDPNRPRYKAEPVVCHACAERSQAAHAASEENQGHPLHGWNWFVSQSVNGVG